MGGDNSGVQKVPDERDWENSKQSGLDDAANGRWTF